MSYIGLFSYYPIRQLGVSAVVCFIEHTVVFQRRVRVQIFPTEHLKIEPWFTNGWQSYGRFKQPTWPRSAIPVAAEWLAIGPGKSVRPG